jgi:hypothetical protein
VFISVELNSFVSEVLIARGLRRDFLQVLIPKRLLDLCRKADPSGHFLVRQKRRDCHGLLAPDNPVTRDGARPGRDDSISGFRP